MPFYIDEFDILIPGHGKNPEMAMSWTKMRILLNWWWFLDTPVRLVQKILKIPTSSCPHPLFTIALCGMHAGSSSLQFRHFLEPRAKGVITSTTQPNAALKALSDAIQHVLQCIQYVLINFMVGLMEMRFTALSFDFQLPVHGCAFTGYADTLQIMFMRNKIGYEGLTMLTIITGGTVDVLNDGELAIQYAGHAARISMDYHHPTKMQDVFINLYGSEDDLAVSIKPFLGFYHKYQTAEDDALEVKLSRGLPTASKMSIQAEFEHMKVSVQDARCPKHLIVIVERTHVEMVSFPLTIEGQRTHKGYLLGTSKEMIPPLLHRVCVGKNVEKVMRVMVQKVTFKARNGQSWHSKYTSLPSLEPTVTDVFMHKVLHVSNENDFMDTDHMSVGAGRVDMDQIEADLLHWLVTLQDTSDRMPFSRFAHRKHSNILMKADRIVTGVQPLAYAFVPDGIVQGPLLPSPPLDNRWVVFTVTALQVTRTGMTGNPVGQYDMSMDMQMHTYLPVGDVLEQYNLHTPSVGTTPADLFEQLLHSQHNEHIPVLSDDCLVSIWSLAGFSSSFMLGSKLDMQSVKMQAFTVSMDKLSAPAPYPFMRIFSNIPHVLGVDCTWNGVHLTATLDEMMVKFSTTSGIHFLCAFGMIKQASNHINANISAAKALAPVFVVKKAVNYFVPDPSPHAAAPAVEVVAVNKIAVRQMTVVVTVEASSTSSAMVIYLHALTCEMGPKTEVQFVTMDMKLSRNPIKPFMSINAFSYSKTTAEIPTTTVTMTSIAYHLHPSMEVGIMTDAMLAQMNAYKVAMKSIPNLLTTIPLDMDAFYDEDIFETPTASPDNCSVMNVKINSLDISLDAPWENIYKTDLMVVSFSSLAVNISQLLPQRVVEDTICMLDTLDGGEMHLKYTNISGGQVTFTTEEMEVNLSMQKETLLQIKQLSFNGPLYAASVVDERIPIEARLIALSCPVSVPDKCHTTQRIKLNRYGSLGRAPKAPLPPLVVDDSPAQDTWDVNAIPVVPLFALYTTQTAANKIYWDLTLRCTAVNINAFPDTMKCIDVINQVLEVCNPPNRDPSPLMGFWDTYRFWIHGLFDVSITSTVLKYFSSYYMQQDVVIVIALADYHLFIGNAIEITTNAIEISSELTIVRLAQRKRSNRNSKSTTTKSVVKFVSIPAVCLSVQFAYTDEFKNCLHRLHSKYAYTHHDVYLLPALEFIEMPLEHGIKPVSEGLVSFHTSLGMVPTLPYACDDRFFYFRSRPASIKYNIEMRLADALDTPLLLFLRIDNILCVLDSFSYTEHHHTPPGTSRSSAPILLPSTGVKKPPNPLTLAGMVQLVDLQCVINKSLLVSWPNKNCLQGVILHHQLAEVQLRVSRKGVMYVDSLHDLIIDSYPLQVDNLVVEIYFAEIYARDMNMPNNEAEMMSKSFKRSSMRIEEDDKVELIEPSSLEHLNALMQPIHKVAYASKVVVSLTESGEVASKLNFQSTGILSAVNEKAVNRKFVIGKARRTVDVQATSKARHTPQSFRSRHRGFSTCSLRRKSVYSFHESSYNGGFRGSLCNFAANHAAFTPPAYALPDSYKSSASIKPAKPIVQFGNQIWGLRVSDTKFLFTISIRDTLFVFFTRANVFLHAGTGEVEGDGEGEMPSHNEPVDDEEKEENVYNINLHSIERRNRSAIMKVEERATLDDFLFVEHDHESVASRINLSNITPKAELQGYLAPDTHFDFVRSPTEEDLGIPDELPPNRIADRVFKVGGRGMKRASAVRRASLYNKGIEMRGESGTNLAELANTPTNAANTSTPSLAPLSIPPHPFPAATAPVTPTAAIPPVTPSNAEKKAKPGTNQYFFIVELVDPQLNFLDVESHSSLIIVAGRSSLEGKRLSTATLAPQRQANAWDEESANTPKRRQEIRLKMDNVVAYTVPTNEEDDCDEVYWKNTLSSVDSYTLRPLSGQDIRRVYRSNKDAPEPLSMLVAINDFQIRACYIFWTDVTIAEAKELKIVRNKEDLIATFRLELPNLSVDIISKQFHIVTNVIKNVMLLPPPHIASSQQQQTSNNVIELKRDEKNTLPLDWTSKSTRDEIRIYIDECLASNLYDLNNQSTVRYTEVFIGRLTWVLRAGNKDSEQLESGFIGIYATLTFTKSRCINTLLEIQRFWAKNLNSNADGVGRVVQPVLKEADLCTRCGNAFNIEANHSTACTFHADDDGNPGLYKQIVVVDELSKKETTVKAWSCCMRHHEFAVGKTLPPFSLLYCG